MKYLKSFFENTKLKNFQIEDVIDCIKNKGYIFTEVVKNKMYHNPDKPLRPLSVDDDGLITVEVDGSEYEVDLKNVEKLEF
jgi:hypothetical protein